MSNPLKNRGKAAPHRRAAAAVGAAAVALMLALWCLPAQANLYSVSGVQVTGRGKTAAEAKEDAVVKGRADALRRLLERLSRKDDHKRLPAPKGKALSALVKGVQVERERAGAQLYRGRLTYIFDPGAVQKLLRQANIAFVETTTRPILVLAIWQEGDRLVLWDDPNPWREVWRNMDRPGSMVRFLRPSGGLKDIRMVDAKRAVDNDKDALTAIANAYKASTVLIAHATADKGRVTILVRRYNPVTGQVRFLQNYKSAKNDAALAKAAAKIVSDFEEAWKASNIIPPGAVSTITVRAPLDGLPYWVRLRDGLKQVSIIRQQRIISLTPGMAVLQISYAGRISHLTEALRQNDLSLSKGDPDDPDAWELRLVTRAKAGGAPADGRDGDRRDGAGRDGGARDRTAPPDDRRNRTDRR